jgi:hypothetical protein
MHSFLLFALQGSISQTVSVLPFLHKHAFLHLRVPSPREANPFSMFNLRYDDEFNIRIYYSVYTHDELQHVDALLQGLQPH